MKRVGSKMAIEDDPLEGSSNKDGRTLGSGYCKRRKGFCRKEIGSINYARSGGATILLDHTPKAVTSLRITGRLEPLANSWGRLDLVFWLGFETYAFPQPGAVVDLAFCNDKSCIANIRNVFERIAVDEDQVSELTSFDGTAFVVEFHNSGRNNCRRLDSVHGSEPRLYEEFYLPSQAVSGNNLVRSHNHYNAGFVHRSDDS